jgi:LPS-assembly lipoprotein
MKKWLVLAILFGLTSCGFYLKGTSAFDTPMPYHSWKVDGGSMQRELEAVLRRQPDVVVDTEKPDVIVKVISATQDSSTSAMDLSGGTSEYLLSLNVSVQVYRHDQPLGNPIQVTVNRYMDYSDHEVLAKEDEQRMIWRDMRTDAAEQIVRRLAFLPVITDE